MKEQEDEGEEAGFWGKGCEEVWKDEGREHVLS